MITYFMTKVAADQQTLCKIVPFTLCKIIARMVHTSLFLPEVAIQLNCCVDFVLGDQNCIVLLAEFLIYLTLYLYYKHVKECMVIN